MLGQICPLCGNIIARDISDSPAWYENQTKVVENYAEYKEINNRGIDISSTREDHHLTIDEYKRMSHKSSPIIHKVIHGRVWEKPKGRIGGLGAPVSPKNRSTGMTSNISPLDISNQDDIRPNFDPSRHIETHSGTQYGNANVTTESTSTEREILPSGYYGADSESFAAYLKLSRNSI